MATSDFTTNQPNDLLPAGRILSITDLAAELEKTMAEHTAADEASIAAYHAKDDARQAEADAEMLRLDRVERSLLKAICHRRAENRNEAIVQAIVGMHVAQLVAEGNKRKWAEHAHTALVSALSLLDAAEPVTMPPEMRHRYFDLPAKRVRVWGAVA